MERHCIRCASLYYFVNVCVYCWYKNPPDGDLLHQGDVRFTYRKSEIRIYNCNELM